MKPREVDPVEGALAKTFQEAMRISDRMKADGCAKEEREAYVAEALKAAWPKLRAEPWHYTCSLCEDTAWRPRVCLNGSCGRPFKLPNQAGDDYTGQGRCQDGHSYVEPCLCAKGRSQRQRLLKQREPEDAVALASRVSKPTRIGR